MKLIPFLSEEAWLKFREGKFTGSQINRLLANDINDRGNIDKLGKGALTYCWEVFSGASGEPVFAPYQDQKMQHGQDNETVAFRELETRFPFEELHHFGVKQHICLVYEHPDVEGKAICSPDGMCPDKFGFEFSSPIDPETQEERFMFVTDNASLKKHDLVKYAQIQFTLMCSGLPYWYWVSHHAGMYNPLMRLHMVKILPDKPFQDKIHAKLVAGVKQHKEWEILREERIKAAQSQAA